jgi:hypothetical protein
MILKVIAVMWIVFTIITYGIIAYEAKHAPRRDDW